MSALFDRLIRTAREYADRYYPKNRRAVLVVVPVNLPDRESLPDPEAILMPFGYLCVPIPDAAAIPPADEDSPGPGAFRMPGCAVAVIAVMLSQREPMGAAEIEAALRGHETFPAYSLSSVEKTLAELVRVGLMKNPAGARPRGYRFAES